MSGNLLKQLKRSPVAHSLMAITFFTSGIIINCMQCILYIGLRPLSKYLYRKLNYYLNYSLFSEIVFMAEWWSGTDVTLYIDSEQFHKYFGKEHGFLLMNHRYDVDWLVGWVFCDRIKVLGNCKAYAKKSIQWVPTMGWGWKFSESVFLERSWDKDKDSIGLQVRELADYPDSIWLLLMAEGTRFTEEKHIASVAFASEKGLPQLKHHLTPRTKGFTVSLPHLRHSVPAIYDVQLAFKPNAAVQPTVMNMLLGIPLEAHMFIQRIPITDVPETEEGAAQWLHDLFQKKDRMMDSFLHTGDWFAESGEPRVVGFTLPRRPYSFMNMAVWAVLTLIPMLYYMMTLVFSGSTLYVAIALAIFTAFFTLLYKLIDQTKISKGSSYGKITPTTPLREANNILDANNSKHD